MRGPIAIAIGLVLAPLACSLAGLDGFSSGGLSAEGDAADGGGDTLPGDAGADDVVDGGDDGDAASTSGLDCDAGTFLLCTSFDDGPLEKGWSSTTLRAGGTLVLDGTARSLPFALRAQIPASTSADYGAARLAAVFDGTLPIRISFDVYFTAPAWGATDKSVGLLEVNYGTTSNSSYLFRERYATTVSIEQASDYDSVEDLPYDRWIRIGFAIVPTTPTGSLRLTYDGRTVYQNLAVPFDASDPATVKTEVYLGLVRYDPPAPSFDVRYDNVTIERIAP